MSECVPADVEDRLSGAVLPASLATCRDGRPHVASVWYRYADGVVEIVTTGRKLDNLRANPRVAVSVVDHRDGLPDWEVTVRGTATIVEDPDARGAAARRINAKYGVEADAWADENTLVRVDVGSATLETW